MCGIIGYVGQKQAQPILLNGLKRLEYRGYDSSGIAILSPASNCIRIKKTPGKIKNLENIISQHPLPGRVGIAHTRWATHGAPTKINAHPHSDCGNKIAIVHNGIIENHALLRTMLCKEGHHFSSETDTEAIVHLVEKFYKSMPLEEAVRKALGNIVGSFAIAVISEKEPGKIIGARLGSPLVVGIGKDENFLASDVPAILDKVKDIIFLNDNEMVILEDDKYAIKGLDGKLKQAKVIRINWSIDQAQKQGYKHFMLKEINEQPHIVEDLIDSRIDHGSGIVFEEMKIPAEKFKNIKNINIVACGTAYHAGIVGKYIIESLCAIPVNVDVSSEFRYRDLLIDKDSLVIAISQSGETADTLAGIREAKNRGASILSICNVLGSTLTRESDGVIYTHAGPEIGVASTKAYIAQLVILYLLAFYIADKRRTLSKPQIERHVEKLRQIPRMQRAILSRQDKIARIAKKNSNFGSFLFLGRSFNYPSALEGALKLKEISYIPAEGYAAGEMKHGPIALIDEYRAVVCITPASKVYDKMVSNIQEILSRRGKVIAIASAGDNQIGKMTKDVVLVPKTEELFSPLTVALPLQLLAYHIAAKRGCDVDQPRNLAKSVTVE
ncbi:MAG: glutamine--fructose-6-phosphate transaminase (isomerizing) [Candidatus Omnitrophota bacterium]|jgi:glucosamine--fructose-6-phosphate aminotransferase (isomerizing)|nr:MAG: glutamine--fructose-6-phosphate transaminase (isomerizing) [Candidatus Omnitrophota bacterium]